MRPGPRTAPHAAAIVVQATEPEVRCGTYPLPPHDGTGGKSRNPNYRVITRRTLSLAPNKLAQSGRIHALTHATTKEYEACTPPLNTATWRTSTYSNAHGGDCVEVATGIPYLIPVRDSKSPAHGTLTLTPSAWATLTTALKRT